MNAQRRRDTDEATLFEEPLQAATNWHEKRLAQWIARRLQGKGPFMMGEAEPSKSQARLLNLLGLVVPERYRWAHKMLRKAGYVGTAIPKGLSWQAAAKLSDDELMKRAKR